MNEKEIESLLAAPEVGMLAIADEQGRPEATPIWFEHDDGVVRLLVHRESHKARSIRVNPQVALTVDTRTPPYKGVLLRGTASLSGPDPQLRRRLARRYLGQEVGRRYIESTASLDEEDALVTIKISSRTSWDYSKGF